MRLTPALMRALDILELFDQRPRWTAGEIAERVGLPRTTTHELVTTLVHRGYLERRDPGALVLGPRAAQLGHAFSTGFDMLGAATDAATTLAHATGETCSVALLRGREVFYLAKVDGREPLQLVSSIGRSVPANCTALGKVLLAALPDEGLASLYPDDTLPTLTDRSIATLEGLRSALTRTRSAGYATEVGESGPHVCCVAAPIRDVGDQAVAALSLSVPEERWAQRGEAHWAAIVLEAGRRLSAQLGHSAGPSGA